MEDNPSWEAATPEQKEHAQTAATTWLWMLTGRVFGLCVETVRPCFTGPDRAPTYQGHSGGAGAVFWPGLIAQGDPLASGPCGCSSPHCCVGQSEVALVGPVHEILHVWIDGQEVPAANYHVRNHRWLLRTDGQQWPMHQDLDAADMEPGAFTVQYKRGIAVPEWGQIAAGILAVEWLAGMNGKRCRLPAGATNISRQGVNVELDPRAFFELGITGIVEVDRWIMTVNPNRLQQPPTVMSPDLMDPAVIS
ncbi:hypothetical protein HH308_06315 [Gordonia sp. TBRC 11910]|uniref:Uncharacterized protein n=1 Tax=Gordonia asplenii TaxID=2725283 RepID=A0A848KQ68_9ACTN|nr:hypothetical protein [Gordonia asplenii]NMO00826.1 hypothetical protein [Gordonia asplenii]